MNLNWRKRRFIGILCSILAIGFLVRIYRLGYQSLWHDEAHSIVLSGYDLKSVVEGIANDLFPPLYNLILHFWMELFGQSEFSVRFLSLIFGVGTVLAVFGLGNLLFNEEVGIWGALLAAISPWLVTYSQEARMYSLVVFLTLLSAFFYLKALKYDRGYYWWSYIGASLLALYTYYFALWVLLFEFIFFFMVWPRHQSQVKRFLLSQVAIAIGFSPWIPTFVSQLQRGQDWKGFIMSLEHIPKLFYVFSLGHTVKLARHNLWIITPTFLVFLFLFIWGTFSRPKVRGLLPLSEGTIFLLLYLFVPIFSFLLFSRLVKANFQDKYLLVAVPAYYLICGRGIALLQRSSTKIIVAVLLIFICGVSLGSLYFNYKKEGWRDVAKYLQEHSRDSDAILLDANYTVIPFLYYFGGGNIFGNYFRGGNVFGVPLGELSIVKNWAENGPFVTKENVERLGEVLPRYQRIWLILSHDWHTDPQGLAEKYLDSNSQRLEERLFPWIRVVLYQVRR